MRHQLCKGFARVRTERDAIEVELFEAIVFKVVDGVDQFNELLSLQLAVVHVDDLQIFLLADEVENALKPIFIREPGRCVAQIQLVQVEHFEMDQVSQDGIHVLVLIIGHVGGPEAFELVRGLQILNDIGKRFHEERLGLILQVGAIRDGQLFNSRALLRQSSEHVSVEIAKVFLFLDDELELFEPCRVYHAVKHIQDAVEDDRTAVEWRYYEPFDGVLILLDHHELQLLLKLSPLPVLRSLVLLK